MDEQVEGLRNVNKNHGGRRATRKRKFVEVHHAEQKDEEEDILRPAKKQRYIRADVANIATVPSNQLRGKAVHPAAAVSKRETVSGQEGDEDIDLQLGSRGKRIINHAQHGQPPQVQKAPPRRSHRLKDKRARRQQLDQQPVKAIRAIKPSRPAFQIPPLEIIVDAKPLDCDILHVDEDLEAPQYAQDISSWYRITEAAEFQSTLIKSNYISTRFQPDLNESMRTILIDWLFSVHRRFQLGDRTIHMALYLLDAYLSAVPIRRNNLQLLGCTALWVSSKYNEIYAPEMTDFVFISDHSFEVDDLSRTEVAILVQLKFRFADIITPVMFLERYLQMAISPIVKKYRGRKTQKANKDGKQYVRLVTQMSLYFCDLALFDCKMISTQKPSLIAASAVCFCVLGIALYSRWPEFLEEGTGYKYEELRKIIHRMDSLRKISMKKKNGKINSLNKKHKEVMKWLIRLNIKTVLDNKE